MAFQWHCSDAEGDEALVVLAGREDGVDDTAESERGFDGSEEEAVVEREGVAIYL